MQRALNFRPPQNVGARRRACSVWLSSSDVRLERWPWSRSHGMTLPPEQKQRVRELFRLIDDEKDPEKVQVLAGELRHLLTVQAPLRAPSDRQLRIMELVAQGLKNREIAEQLGISSKVVKNYLRNIYDKLGHNNRVQLALWYEKTVYEGKIHRSS
jgi:DNA-binding NarL/FixJ family response regulator